MMSAIHNLYAPSHAQDSPVSADTNWRVCAFILLLFILAGSLSAVHKDVTKGFDEVAHASYVAHLQHHGETWPNLKEMRMLDPLSFRFTSEPNYLSHPSPYYVLLARLGPKLEGHPGAIIIYRLFNVALAAIGLTALMTIGLMARLSRFALYAYVIPLACIPVLAPIAGSINNDNAAFAGGGIATLAALQLIATGSRTSLMAALGGVIIASWAKLTGLLLVGGLVSGVLAWLVWRGRFQLRWIAPIAIAVLMAIAPYVTLLAQYGGPVPTTPGLITMWKTGAHAAGWDTAERLSPAAYAVHFVIEFILEWMPTLKSRNTLNYVALLIPVVTVLCAFAGLIVSAQRIARGNENPFDIVVAVGALVFAATLVIHCITSYGHHVEYGSIMDAYPRYYVPLAGIIPLAGLSLLSALKQPRARAILVGFLIAGPVAFRLLGAPLG